MGNIVGRLRQFNELIGYDKMMESGSIPLMDNEKRIPFDQQS